METFRITFQKIRFPFAFIHSNPFQSNTIVNVIVDFLTEHERKYVYFYAASSHYPYDVLFFGRLKKWQLDEITDYIHSLGQCTL